MDSMDWYRANGPLQASDEELANAMCSGRSGVWADLYWRERKLRELAVRRVAELELQIADQALMAAELNSALDVHPVVVWDPQAECDFESKHSPPMNKRNKR